MRFECTVTANIMKLFHPDIPFDELRELTFEEVIQVRPSELLHVSSSAKY